MRSHGERNQMVEDPPLEPPLTFSSGWPAQGGLLLFAHESDSTYLLFRFFYFSLCVYVRLCVALCTCILSAPQCLRAHRAQKRASDPLELE